VCRAFYPDLHRCACQWPGLGMTIFFPGQRPLPDGHGVHSLPPPPRMYEPSWQGRHWPARGVVRVERLGSTRHRPRQVQGDHRAPIAPASALSLTKARQIELAPFSLTKPRQVLSQRKNCKQRTQAPVALNAPFSTGTVVATIALEWEAASCKTVRAKRSARKLEQTKEQTKLYGSIPSAASQHAATRLARYRD
jgi:hypothetical protein